MTNSAVASEAGSSNASRHTLAANTDNLAPLLGEDAEALISCNQKLQELGIQNTIRLPQICVIGDQSTGKSSLIEAISTVKVPKAKGCCTQCPIAINLSSGDDAFSPWKCTVYIEENYEYVESLVPKGVTKNNPFGPWQRNPSPKVLQVKTTNDKNEVPGLIQAAQDVILNPGSQPQDYLGILSRKKSANHATKFSPNLIRLDVSEGNWPNLSFIDLPGVIANTGREKEKYLVKLIRNLVHQYASADRSVNMLTLPMTHDIENSQACAIIQELKAEAHTLAVFTKADLADDDQRAQFLRRFMGTDDLGFEHGYHFVVMPDNIEQEEARAAEAAVFAEPPWSQLDQKYQDRLGVDALRTYLRQLLFKKTRETLPENLHSIKIRLSEVDAELTTMPPPPNAVLLPLQLQQSVTHLENAMKMQFCGDQLGDGKSARTEWLKHAIGFRNTVISAKPTVWLLTDAEQVRMKKAKAKTRKQQLQAGSNSNAIEVSSEDEPDYPLSVKAERSATTEVDHVHRFKLDEIRHINERYYQACVPGEIELRAIEEMNKLSVKCWNPLLTTFMHATSTLLNTQIMAVLEDIFHQYRHLELLPVIREHVKSYLEDIINREWSIADEVCMLERERPFTLDIESLKEKEAKSLQERTTKRNEKRQMLWKSEQEAMESGAKQKKKKDDDLEPDPYYTELVMSSKTRAYYEVASVRFVDNICVGIFGRLLPACTDKLVNDLKDFLGLYDPAKHEQIICWMTENPERETKRQQLLHEREQLVEGMRYIEDVLGSAKSSPSKRRKPTTSESPEPTTPSKRVKTAGAKKSNGWATPPTQQGLVSRVRSMSVDD